jgi:glycerol-3-phosphate acyltransferase PlsY
MLYPILIWSAAYLVGSIPFGWLIARSRGVDIFKEGSGNLGATNVGRVLGKPLGMLVFLLDFAKGAGPVAAASLLSAEHETFRPGTLEAGAGLAAFVGHLFPIYLRFHGGKGVATAAGVVTVLVPLPALAGLLAFIAVVTATRYVSLACLVADVVLVALYLVRANAIDFTDPRTVFLLVATALVFYRHRGNIARLREGSERRIGEHPALEPAARSLHVLSLGLWCGMGVFFSFVMGPTLFREFEALGDKPAAERDVWFPLPAAFEASDDSVQGPKEQGSRAFGFAVGSLFSVYFLLQFLCGTVAFGTALGWPRRLGIIGLAFALVIAGWTIEQKVAALRPARNDATTAYLQAGASERETLRPAMLAARKEFGGWHVVSLFMDMTVVGLATIALAMAGNLPRQSA